MKIYGLAYAHDLFVAVGEHVIRQGENGSGAGFLLTSSDGHSWQERVHRDDAGFDDLLSGNERLVVLGHAYIVGATTQLLGVALSSSDAQAWEQVELPDPPPVFESAYHRGAFGNGWFVALGQAATLRSTDGLSWEARGPGYKDGGALAFANGIFVSGSFYSAAMSDGDNDWQPLDLNAVAEDRAAYLVALDAHGPSLEATFRHDCCFGEVPDLIHWSQASSLDGVTWTHTVHGFQQPPPRVVLESDSLCLAFQGLDVQSGAILAGDTCDALKVVHTEQFFKPHAFLRAQGRYFVGADQGLFESDDGLTWRAVDLLH